MGMALDGPMESEEIHQVNGVDLLVNSDAKAHTSGKILDYITSPEGDGFIIQAESGQCGC